MFINKRSVSPLKHLFDWQVSQPTLVKHGDCLPQVHQDPYASPTKPNTIMIDVFQWMNYKPVIIFNSCIAMHLYLSIESRLPMCLHACVCIFIDMCCWVWVYICLPLFVPVSPAAHGDRWVISVIGSPPCHHVPVFVDRPCFNLAFVSNLR